MRNTTYIEHYGKYISGGIRIWKYRGGLGISWEANEGFRICIHLGICKLWFGYFKDSF